MATITETLDLSPIKEKIKSTPQGFNSANGKLAKVNQLRQRYQNQDAQSELMDISPVVTPHAKNPKTFRKMESEDSGMHLHQALSANKRAKRDPSQYEAGLQEINRAINFAKCTVD